MTKIDNIMKTKNNYKYKVIFPILLNITIALFVIVFLSSCKGIIKKDSIGSYYEKNKNLKEYATDEWVEHNGKKYYFNSDGYLAKQDELPYGYYYVENSDLIKRKEFEILKFGTYEQDGNLSNGKEAIEWIVIDETDSYYKLLSKYALDCKFYYNVYSSQGVPWEYSYMRGYLNNQFFQENFTHEEQNRIINTINTLNDNDKRFFHEASDYTEDKVYLLSINEIYRYFPFEKDRICEATNYAILNGVYTNNENKCSWFTRSVADLEWQIFGISIYGKKITVYNAGKSDGMRVALCIKK